MIHSELSLSFTFFLKKESEIVVKKYVQKSWIPVKMHCWYPSLNLYANLFMPSLV